MTERREKQASAVLGSHIGDQSRKGSKVTMPASPKKPTANEKAKQCMKISKVRDV